MTNRREVLLGAAGALSAGLLGVDDAAPVSYDDADGVRPVNLTGYGTGDGPDVLGLEHLTGFDELEVSTSGTVPTLRADAETTSDVSVRIEAEVSRAELVALRDEIDAALLDEQ
jgi:hypothetical protein